MTHPLTMERFNEAPVPARLPAPDSCIVLRPQLAEHLDLGVTALLTVMQAPTGAGKSTSAATWASGVSQARGLVWLELDAQSARPSGFLAGLVDGLVRAGATGMPTLAGGRQMSPARRRAARAAVAEGLRGTGPWILVVDDFPTGTTGQLGVDLEWLLQHSERALRAVILTNAEPAIALHRLRMSDELRTITSSNLAFERDEVAELLEAFQVEPSEHVVDGVMRHTRGWALGVRLAASALRDKPLSEAMSYAEHAIDEYVSLEVLDQLPPDSRELVLRLSFAETVAADLASVVMDGGHELQSARASRSTGFVERDPDGTLRLHPVLRTVAARRLLRDSPGVARQVASRAARWYADQGQTELAVRLAIRGSDWSWAATTLVESLTVPAILAGSVPVSALPPQVLDCEPLLGAAVAASAGQAALAEAKLHASAHLRGDSSVEALSRCFVELELANRAGDAEQGLPLAADARALIHRLYVEGHAETAELTPHLDAVSGELELWNGKLHQAAGTLSRTASSHVPRGSQVRRNALGSLALLEAMRGNLREAARMSNDVEVAASRFGGTAGIVPGRLASAWVHVERSEVDAALRCLSAVDQVTSAGSPWPVVGSILAARLKLDTGEPETAVRMITSLQSGHEPPKSALLADMVVIHLARTLLAMGEPRRALAVLTPEPGRCLTEARVVGAQARYAIGDVRGARALLSTASPTLEAGPLGVQVEAWLLEARLACDADEADRARQLLDRTLRAAAVEDLRSPLVSAQVWIRGLVARDPALMRAHRDLLARVQPRQAAGAWHEPSIAQSHDLVIEPLTDREREVLELLAVMCSTEEIAAELFVSGNTVKTHVKGIFRKLGVNRRVDAVRAGRDLGLC